MGKKNEGNFRKISDKIFKRITRKKAKERINDEFESYIKKEEKEIGEKLTKEEIRELRQEFFATRGKKIIEEEARKARGKATVLALVGFLGVGGVGGYALGTHDSKIPGITDGRTAIEVDMNEVDKDVEIENVFQEEKEDKHALFVKELQDAALNETIEENDILEKEVKQKIESLETPKEVVDYIKQMYVEAYNNENEEKIGKEDLELYKATEDLVFYEDKAQNGDEILRYCTEAEAEKMGIPIDGDLSKISAEVKTDSGLEIENVAYHDGKFVTLYSKNEEVLENKETILCELGNVVLQGIDRSVSMDEKDTSWNAKEDYKNKFIQAVVDYKKSKGEITAENNKIQAHQATQDGFEPSDD